jgi:PAS domain S-box-containing protein
MAATPRLLCLPDAEVRMEPAADGFRYSVRTIRRGGLFARVRRSVRWLLDSRGVAAELREAYDSLRSAHQLLLEESAHRARTQGVLREREAQLRSLVSHAPVVLFALDRDGVFVLSDGRGLDALGLRPGEVVGRSVFDVYRDFPRICDDCRRAIRGEDLRTTARVGDLAFEIRYSPRFDANGEADGTIGVAIDVTERLRAQESLRAGGVSPCAPGALHGLP